MCDNSNNVHFSGVRFICSPYLAIKLALASLGPIMTMNIIVILPISIETCVETKIQCPTFLVIDFEYVKLVILKTILS